jgi:2-methylisocitrate lyase-like PEP mutase family enzyme
MSGAAFRKLVSRPEIVVAPGCYDALTALMIERAGFPAAYVSGGSIAYTHFARPDIGLISMSEVAEIVGLVRERVELPLVVDVDTGFGNALNVQRTVRVFAARGASALQLEDQTMPKRCGHLAEKRLVSKQEMVGKVKAALDATGGDGPLVIARTDAIAVEGFDAALDRAEAYLEAGAEMLFIEAPRSEAELAGIARRFKGRVPLMANMVEGGATPITGAKQLEELGFSFVIFPGGTVRAIAKLLAEYLQSLKTHGTTAPFRDRMLDFKQINALIGTPEMLAKGKTYEGE